MINPAMMKRLKEHSKAHEGGMNGKHMKNMVKFVKQGDSFSKAHSKAKEMDKAKPNKAKPNKAKPKKTMMKKKPVKKSMY